VVEKESEIIKLTKKEIALLELLLQHKHATVSIEQIEHSVWEEPASSDAIRMVIAGIRKKLYPEVIENIKGVGYRLNI
jgi:DNA-binding response OmpR family regulator